MRAVWSGNIGFGLVNIPVKLYSATQSSRLDLDMLDRKDRARIRYRRVNEETGREVPWDEIVKAYYYKDRYILLEEADLEEASPEKNKMIAIQEFVDEKEIDGIYFDTPYYIEPDKAGAKPYSLLLKALKKTRKAGVATFVLRTVENLAIIRAKEDVLFLNKLRFREEIRPRDELKIPGNIRVAKEELDMAVQLVKQYGKKFDISRFRDEYSRDLMKIVRAKAAGKRPTIRKLKPRARKSEALLDQLKESLSSKKASSQ